jgi:hypothetical protein
MSKYLVVAHQTATSGVLIETLSELAAEDASAQFTLVVPATKVQHLLTYVDGEAQAAARATGEEARSVMERAGIHVSDVTVGDESPLQAIADALAGASYDAIIISTLPPGISRWLNMDVHTQAKRRFNVPVISVITPKEAAVPAGGRL